MVQGPSARTENSSLSSVPPRLSWAWPAGASAPAAAPGAALAAPPAALPAWPGAASFQGFTRLEPKRRPALEASSARLAAESPSTLTVTTRVDPMRGLSGWSSSL